MSSWIRKQLGLEPVTPIPPLPEDFVIMSLEAKPEQEQVSTAQQDERTKNVPAPEKLMTLFKIDPVVQGIVQQYVDAICSGFYLEGGDPEDRKLLTDWINNTGLIYTIRDGIQDIFTNGNWWMELLPDYKAKGMSFKGLNPLNMDYLRDMTKGNNVLMDKYGYPVGYKQIGSQGTYAWKEDGVYSGEGEGAEKIDTPEKKEDMRTRIVHIKLFSYSDSYLGFTPLSSVYKSALIRLNLSDMVGESGFRGGGLVAYLTGKPSEQTRVNLETTLKNSTSRNIYILEDKIKLDSVPMPDLNNRENLLYYYADEICAGMGIPLSNILSGTRSYAGDKQILSTKFEERIKPMQQRLAYQIRNKIFTKLWEVWTFDPDTKIIPYLKFSEITPYAKLNTSRTVATLARAGMLRYDPTMEERFREVLGLPTELIVPQVEQWIKESRAPEQIQGMPVGQAKATPTEVGAKKKPVKGKEEEEEVGDETVPEKQPSPIQKGKVAKGATSQEE